MEASGTGLFIDAGVGCEAVVYRRGGAIGGRGVCGQYAEEVVVAGVLDLAVVAKIDSEKGRMPYTTLFTLRLRRLQQILWLILQTRQPILHIEFLIASQEAPELHAIHNLQSTRRILVPWLSISQD